MQNETSGGGGDDASDVFVSAVRQEVKWPFLSTCRFEYKSDGMCLFADLQQEDVEIHRGCGAAGTTQESVYCDLLQQSQQGHILSHRSLTLAICARTCDHSMETSTDTFIQCVSIYLPPLYTCGWRGEGDSDRNYGEAVKGIYWWDETDSDHE